MRRGLKLVTSSVDLCTLWGAARAAPYEKGTETEILAIGDGQSIGAARAAPYEKGTETRMQRQSADHARARRARGPL